MVFLRNEFARFELNTGLYYLRRGAWVSAADRATYLLETYPQSEYQNDAVAVLGESYTAHGQCHTGRRCQARAAAERSAASVAGRQVAEGQGHHSPA
jgi:outer membrane protein assembly factor BamD (BamD/ComL family)